LESQYEELIERMSNSIKDYNSLGTKYRMISFTAQNASPNKIHKNCKKGFKQKYKICKRKSHNQMHKKQELTNAREKTSESGRRETRAFSEEI